VLNDTSHSTAHEAGKKSKNTEAIVEAKVSAKIGLLRDEIHGTTQLMKSHVKKLKSDAQYKWRSEGNRICLVLPGSVPSAVRRVSNFN
jgi:cellobiose-specific phosphotransferase system component IIC